METNPFVLKEEGQILKFPYSEKEFEELVGSEADPTFVVTALAPTARLRLFVLFSFLGFSLLSYVGYLGVVQGDASRLRAEGNRLRRTFIAPPRGLILDRRGKALARNVAAFRIELNPHGLTDIFREKWQSLVSDDESFLPLIQGGNDRVNSRLVSHKLGLRLRVLAHEFPSLLKVTPEPARLYPLGDLAIHVLGYLALPTAKELERGGLGAHDRTGRLGLESTYDGVISGRPGEEIVEVDAVEGVKEVFARHEPQVGDTLPTTLDFSLQQTLGRSLGSAIKTYGAAAGAAVVLDIRNCEILALLSLPAPDPHLLSYGGSPRAVQTLLADPSNPFFNRSIAGTYPPGSTIKPFFAYGALRDGLISERTTVVSSGGVRVGAWFFPDWRAGGHGVVDIYRAMAQSVNTFFYLIGGGSPPGSRNLRNGLGIDGLYKIADLFDLNEKTGIDIEGEQAGFFPTPEWKLKEKQESWFIGDTYHAAIGQGDVLVTPLELARAYATLANGAFSCTPHLSASVNPDWQRLPLDREALRVVRRALRETVISGSARRLADLTITSAGKTGTAQASRARSHAWYAGFAPYENPEIAFAIILEGGGEGGIAAVPVARDLLQAYAKLSTVDTEK